MRAFWFKMGKLRQRVGEIVSRGQNKTAFSEEFKVCVSLSNGL